MKPVLMIHEVREWMLDLPLEDYILTFDDGLYSQYFYFDHFKKLKTEKYFFISTNIVCPEHVAQSNDFPTCEDAHKSFFENQSTSHYMKWSQIKEIYQTPNCFIGGHSHNHHRHDEKSIEKLYQNLNSDTEAMLSEFAKQGMKVESFCYPYNKQYVLYETLLKKKEFKIFFGDERIAIESLQ
ncbi:polysaccharide deacetylase family protein [Peredibacter sp. HCB2-198]|uniref:polysaccharide deacetylase family protein n=1 Tax=Peredibacter sp. HCB2-198 TaxID=3383025 RepID=UPI0038B423FF